MPTAKPSDTITLPQDTFGGRLGCSINEAAAALNLERDSIYRMIGDGRLIASKFGRRTVVHVASIHQLLADTVIAAKPRVRHVAAPTPAGMPKQHHRRGKAVRVLAAAATTP